MGDGGKKAVFGFFQKSDDLSAFDCWKTSEKFIDGIARFEVVHQGLQRACGFQLEQGVAAA